MDHVRDRRAARGALAHLLVVLAVAALAPCAARAAAGEDWLLDDPSLRALGAAELAARPPRFPFGVGERLEYAVSWFGVPAGTAVIEIARFVALGDERYAHVVATARTNAVFSLVHAVDDRSEAWIDLDRFVTVRTRAVMRRPGKWYDDAVRYDWPARLLHARLDKRHKGQRRELVLDFGPHAHDTSDLVYALRALRLGPGARVGLPTYADRKLFEFRVDVAPGPRLATPLGRVETLAVRPSTWLDGAPHAAGEGVVYVAGEARVPVRLEGWVRTAEQSFLVHGLRATLVRYDAGAPSPHAPAPAFDAAMPATRNGVPQWDPPADVRAARAAAGLAVRDVRTRIPEPAVGAGPR